MEITKDVMRDVKGALWWGMFPLPTEVRDCYGLYAKTGHMTWRSMMKTEDGKTEVCTYRWTLRGMGAWNARVIMNDYENNK